MRRAPIVVGATGAGLAALLSFHTTPLSGPTGPLVSAAGPGPGGSGTASSPGPTPTTTAPTPTTPTTTTPTTATPTTATPATVTPTPAPPTTRAPVTTTTQGPRRADGTDVFYRYGELELQVTIGGGRITAVQPVVDNASDPRSAQINDEAIPYLRQQALQAQSANIDGVSGATYTSEAYAQSLQAALDKLGWNK
jgi:uncharacterized protein with FMN-binding domain